MQFSKNPHAAKFIVGLTFWVICIQYEYTNDLICNYLIKNFKLKFDIFWKWLMDFIFREMKMKINKAHMNFEPNKNVIVRSWIILIK